MNKDSITFGIVEDETLERETMCLFIENSFPAAQVLWQSSDGKSGLENWKKNPVDVLIVDIRMPIMDGLCLCEELYQLQCQSVIVINTAYDSFSYARRAISLHAFDYIVKPSDNQELFETLKNCISEAKKRRAIYRQQTEQSQAARVLGHLAVSELIKNPQEAVCSTSYLEPIGWPAHDHYQTRVIHFISSAPMDAEHMNALEQTLSFFPDTDWLTASNFKTPRHMIALVEPKHDFSSQKLYTLFWIFGKYYTRHLKLFIRISTPCADKEMIALECAWQPATNLSNHLDIPKRHWKILRGTESEKLTYTLQRYFSDSQFSRAIRSLKDLVHTYSDPELQWELVQWIFLAILNVWPGQPILEIIKPMCLSDTTEQNWEVLIDFCKTLPVPDTGDVFDRALLIMKQEFGQDLSQSNLANRLGLEQGYFSKLFKKRCGRNFSEVLTDIRMQHAEQLLLADPDITLDELCNACGLSSKTYFSEAFKKWKGMTITQYLKLHKT